jgi:phage baseplate assembly protein gpV
VWLAIVIDNKDGDGNPGYRVKLKYPWLSEQDTSHWARIAVPMGGSNRGTYVLPEIDDQVLVVFEHGDINRPIVVGSLWSKKQEPVENNQSGSNHTKLIKSRSGHRIIFDDKEGAEKLIIVDKTKKNKIVLDSANKLVRIESDGDIEVRAKANVIMHSNALKIGTSQAVTGKGALLLAHAAKTFGLKATSSITIGGGSTTINVSNAAATRVSGSGSGELGGGGSEAARSAGGDGGGGPGGGGAGGTSAGSAAPAPVPVSRAQAPRVPDPARDPAGRDDEQVVHFAEVRVVDASGQPAVGLSVRLTRADGVAEIVRTDADGVARWDKLPPGEHKIDLDQHDAVLELR